MLFQQDQAGTDYDCATTDNKEGKMFTLTSSPLCYKGLFG